MEIHLADAAAIPLNDASADLAVAFMSLQDVDDMQSTIQEIERILEPRGRLCLAIVHPINSAGSFDDTTVDAKFVIDGSYLRPFDYADSIERDGLEMTFHSRHRPLESYFKAMMNAGLLVETLREPTYPEEVVVRDASRRWQRIPLFLHIRAQKP